jgi:ESCRT-II complex subunit VPS22
LRRVQLRRGSNALAIELDDIRRAIEKVKVLGKGFSLVTVGHQKMVLSVPVELNRDHTALLSIAEVHQCPLSKSILSCGWAQGKAYTTKAEISSKYGWPEHRISSALELVLQEGMAWIDSQTGDKDHHYWFPALYNANQ